MGKRIESNLLQAAFGQIVLIGNRAAASWISSTYLSSAFSNVVYGAVHIQRADIAFLLSTSLLIVLNSAL